MKKKTKWIIIITLMSCLTMLVYGYTGCGGGGDESVREPDYGVLLAVPSDAGVIVKANDLCGLCAALSNDCAIWTQVSSLPKLKNAAKTIYMLDTIAQNNNSMRMLLQGKSAMVSFHRENNVKMSALVGIQIGTQDYNTLMRNIANYIHGQNLLIKKITYDKATIYIAVDPQKNDDTLFFMTYTDGFFLASKSRLTVEQAVRHIHSDNASMKQDKSLKRLLSYTNSDATAVLIFNYKQMGEMFANDISKNTFNAVSGYANWSVLDISVKKQVATCAGYTDCNKPSQILSIIKSQKPVPNSCPEYLPSKTTSFVSMGISDMHLFENDYKNHLQSTGAYADFESNNEWIRKTYGINFAEALYTNLTGRITEFSCTYNLAGRSNDHYVIAELNDADSFEKQMASLCQKYRQREKIADKDGVVRITTSKGNQYVMYKFPIKHTFSSFFGNIFAAESEYMMIYHEKAVFGKTVNALYEYANNIDNEKTLANNSIYENFVEFVNGQSNLYYYIDIAYSQEEISKSLSKSNAKEIADNYAKLHSLRSMALQYSPQDKGVIYTNAALMHSTATEAERLISWIAQTDTTIRGKPQIVSRHETDDKDVIVQDETYKLYLFDKNGKREFGKQMGEPLMSQIYQIDLYGNHKKQYVFATEHFLHALDRNGNYLDNFPVQLPSSVSAEISVFDYDGTRDYRIFVPCTDRTLYVYTKEGTKLDTWTPLHTNEPIVTPVQFFRVGDNDLLVFADNLKTYIVNRRGEVRINVTNSFPKARNSLFYLEYGEGIVTRFVTSNSSGEIKYIYTDGSCKSQKFKNLSANHHFALKDINGDGAMEYIFTDQDMLYVFRADGSEVFSHCFEGTVGRPNFFKFANNDVRIGITCRSQRQLFLFDNKGKICSGFPLQGTSEFSITRLSKNAKFSLLTGNADNYLYNYIIQ